MRHPAPALQLPARAEARSTNLFASQWLLAILGSFVVAFLFVRVDSATALPSGFGIEKVSPDALGKNDSDIPYQGGSVRASADGSRVTWLEYSASPGDEGGTFPGQALATLGSAGWVARGVMPRVGADLGGAAFYNNDIGYQAFDASLTRGAVAQAGPALVPGASEEQGMRNLYVRDLSGVGGYSLLTPPPLGGYSLKDTPFGYGTILYSPVVADATPDFSHVVYETSFLPLVDGAVGGAGGPTGFGVPNVYEWAEGELRLVSIMPDGSPAPEGAVAGAGMRGGVQGSASSRAPGDRVVSNDGSRVFFTVPKAENGSFQTGDVYARIDGNVTQHVSKSQRSTPDPEGTQPALFVTASTDGRYVFIASAEKLTDDSTAQVTPSVNEDLYRYDTVTEELLDLTAGVTCGFAGFIGASHDGNTIYFGCGLQVYVWTNGTLESIVGDYSADFEFPRENFTSAIQNSIKRSTVSADGRWAVLSTSVELSGQSTNGTTQLFVYDRETGDTRCVSCPADGPPSSSAYTNNIGVFTDFPIIRDYLPRNFNDAGTLLTFATADLLSPEDRNSRVDVYQYETATRGVRLMSQGTGTKDAYIEDVSADGETVFFATRERLLPEDNDGLVDLYVTRRGAHPPAAEPPAPCEGEACQGELTGPPAATVAGTAVLVGPSDARPKRKPRCGSQGKSSSKKGGCKQRRKGKKRSKQHRKPTERTANANRGSNR